MKPTYEELRIALGKAIATYEYASMTSWERECFADEMKYAEDIYDRSCEDEVNGKGVK